MTPAESDEEDDGGPELDLTPAAATRALGYVGSPPPPDENAQEIPRPVSTDASRLERGLGSPMLRRDSENQIRDRTSCPLGSAARMGSQPPVSDSLDNL